MQKHIFNSRLGGTALAAVLALSATPAFAQEVTPQEVPQATVPAQTTPTVITPPAAEPTVTATPDPLAAEPAADAAPVPEAKTKATTSAKSVKPTASKPAGRSAPVKTSAPAAATAAVPVAAEAAPVPEPLPADPLPVDAAPIAEPAAPAPVAAAPADETLPIALGAGLGVLALGGAAFALRRRRRDRIEDELIVDEPTIARQPVEPLTATPAMAERSAFSWGNSAPAASATRGRTWVERAHDGPTPENPFLSLKKRLQRAAFYDQRERAVAAGSAKPLSPMAGLPSRFAEAIKAKTAAPAYGFSYVPA